MSVDIGAALREAAEAMQPEPVRPPRPRKPLPDAFRTATYDAVKAAERLERLAADDRLPRNAEQVGRTCRHDLLRAADLLATVVDRLSSASTQEG